MFLMSLGEIVFILPFSLGACIYLDIALVVDVVSVPVVSFFLSFEPKLLPLCDCRSTERRKRIYGICKFSRRCSPFLGFRLISSENSPLLFLFGVPIFISNSSVLPRLLNERRRSPGSSFSPFISFWERCLSRETNRFANPILTCSMKNEDFSIKIIIFFGKFSLLSFPFVVVIVFLPFVFWLVPCVCVWMRAYAVCN